jgi:hypothetical protein
MLLKNKILGLIFILFFMSIINYVSAADVNYTTGGGVYGVFADGSTTNLLNLTFQFTTCSLSDCSDANFSTIYTNATLSDLSSLNNASYFQYKTTFFTENQNYTPYLFNTTIDYTYLDITYPLLSFISPTPSNNSVASGSFTVNVSITEENLKNVTWNWNGALITFNSTNESLTDLGSGSWLFTYTQTGLVVGQSYTYNVSISDFAGNTNSTETRTINGNTAPTFISVLYTPNSTDDLDPSTNISVVVNISDSDDNFDSAILQWKNSTGGYGENNITMANITEKSSYTILNATLPLPSYESNITFRILANDTAGDSAYSDNYTLESFWDCTWTATSDLGAVSGWNENKFIGNITINNTGDSEHSTGCSLDFRLTYDLTEGRIYYGGEYIKNLIAIESLSAKSNQTIQINATFLSEVKQENVIITLDELRERSSTRYRNTTATIISNQAGPYLYQTITSNPNLVYLTNSNFSLNAYLRNLMGSSTVNENDTAYNVSFYWTLPSGITNTSGNLSTNFTNITDNELHYNNIEAGFSNLASMTSGAKTFYLYSYGYNLSGDLIQDANGNLNLSNSVEISFLCYPVSDGVCVTSCGYTQDPDCTAPTTSPDSSGGGGGGGGGTVAETIRTSADFQLIRGEQNEVKIVFENKDKNQSLKDLTFSVSGKIAKYTDLSPKQISSLEPGQKITVTLTITSPTYIELGKQELVITMKGKKGTSDFIDSKKVTLEIHELSIERAEEMLNESRQLINKLNNANLSYDYLNQLLNESETALGTFNLEVIRDNYKKIQEQVKYALDSMEIIKELESLIKAAEKKGIDVSESKRLVKLAKLSVERREFEQAYSRVKNSQLTYALEVKGEFGKLSYYVKEYPGEISLATLFLIIFSFGTYKIDKLRRVKKKIKELKDEEKILNELIRVVQKECFKDKKMSMGEYETAMKEYNKKLSRVIEELIEMETKRVHMLRFTSKNKLLKIEKERIIEMIKELQGDYMKKRKLETRTFELKMESFNKRIGEIEENLATLEAKRAVRGFGISLKIPDEK